MLHKRILIAAGTSVLVLAGCSEQQFISNELMTSMYPASFRPGNPPYLERDFEAGANFICDEIKIKRGQDLCSEPDINWR